MGLLYEVRLLLAPGRNDSDDELRSAARWLLGVDPGMRITINSFMTHGVRPVARRWPEAGDEDRERYRAILIDAGVRPAPFVNGR
jgi:pyruvate formate lyase activating enzyme